VAGGIVKGILAAIAAFGIDTGAGDFAIFNMISDIPFYFLPFLLAMSTSDKFRVNRSLALCVAGSLMYPTIVNAVGTGETPLALFGFTVPIFSYADSVFPVIFGVIGLSFVYRAIDKVVPDLFKLVVVPALSLAIVIPVNLFVLAPIGAWCGLGLANGIVWLFSTLGPVAGFLLGFFMPLIVLFGMHQSTSPIQISNIATLGYDYLLPISFCHNLAESGASFGAALRMTDEKLKSAAMTCAFSAFMGISEPALFTVQVPNRTPLIAAMIADGIGGALTVVLGAKCFGFVMPGITSLPVYADPSGNPMNLIMIVVCIALTWVISATLSFALYGRFDKK
jgi:PTS system beta-glucosides-specific IIC component